MAAGRGTRLMPLTKKFPKGMIKVKNNTLISNGIHKLKKQIKYLHITVGYKKSILAKYVIEKNVSSVFNTEGKGNAWWIFNTTLKYLNEPMFVLTCDNITEVSFKKIENDYKKKNNPICMLVPIKPIKGLEGDYIHHKNKFVKELSRSKKSNIYCTGIQIINPFKINQIMQKQKDFKSVWSNLIKMKKVLVSDVMPKKWFTIDNPRQLKNYIKDN